ncbi:MAG: hypothetical protein ACK5M7_05850 [Draconibacterium sp.]
MKFKKTLNPCKHILLISCLIFSSCATIINGKSSVLIFSNADKTKAEVFLDGERLCEAPGKIRVPKAKIQHGSQLVIQADGYQPNKYTIVRRQNAVYTVIDLLIGGVPLVVDYTTGNLYQPQPRKFEYKLIQNTTNDQD